MAIGGAKFFLSTAAAGDHFLDVKGSAALIIVAGFDPNFSDQGFLQEIIDMPENFLFFFEMALPPG